MGIKKIILYYLVLFFLTAGVLIEIGDFLASSRHRAENKIFHEENVNEFVQFLKQLNPEKDTGIIDYYFAGHINHYANLRLVGIYKKTDSLLILTRKKCKNITPEFLNIYDTMDIYNLDPLNNDVFFMKLTEGNYIIKRTASTSPYYIAALLTRSGMFESYIPFYTARLILLLFTIAFIFITVHLATKKLLIKNFNRIEHTIRQIQKEEEVNCSQKTGIYEFDEICKELSGLASYIRKRYQRFYEESIRDPLTGAFNLRKFYEDIEHVRKECMLHKTGFVLLIIDVDNFKHVNDTLGHLEGDKVLKEVVYIIKSNIRESDGVYRYGGDEFTVILKNTDEEGAYRIAERIRKEVENNTNTTVSIGGSYFFVAYTATELMREADRKLYIAKKLGKNRTVILWEDTESTFHEFGENDI